MEQLQCSLCLQRYRSPRILPCLHSFCTPCLEVIQHDEGEGEQKLVICCPECATEHTLYGGGVRSLPANVYLRNVIEMTTSSVASDSEHRWAPCDVCAKQYAANGLHLPGPVPVAALRCAACRCNLCPRCDVVHREKTQHATHCIDASAWNDRVRTPDHEEEGTHIEACLFCSRHIYAEARVYCETCKYSVCASCEKVEHQSHTCVRIEDSSVGHLVQSTRTLHKARTLMDDLQEGIKSVQYTVDSLQAQSTKVAAEICDVIDARMRALQDHKRSLLQQLDVACTQKEQALLNQASDLQDTLDAVALQYDLATSAARTQLQSGETPSVRSQLRKLEGMVLAQKELKAVEDDYLQFRSDLPAGQRQGMEMLGRIDSIGPSPCHCTAFGPGLDGGTVRHVSHFTVSVYDRHGQLRALGGDTVEVRVTDPTGRWAPARVEDNGGGVYLASYTPSTAGEHQVSVTVEGHDIKESPFVVTVVSPCGTVHTGTFHCCAQCSTRGNRNVTCGCGGTMPGGFSGCGHGHPGHPGAWHWSCCGQLERNSMCSRTANVSHEDLC